jgi:hypothetical protein
VAITRTASCNFMKLFVLPHSVFRVIIIILAISPNVINHFDVRTVHLLQFIIQTNKCAKYTFIYLCIVSTATCFNASASSSGSLILLLGYSYKCLFLSGFPIKLYHKHLSSPIRLRQTIYSSHIIILYTIMLSIFCEMYWLWSYYYAIFFSLALFPFLCISNFF